MRGVNGGRRVSGEFLRGEREAWREKSVMVALRVRGKRALKLEKKKNGLWKANIHSKLGFFFFF